MRKKIIYILSFLGIIVFFLILKITANHFENNQIRIAFDTKKTNVQLSKLVKVSEDRIQYIYTSYLDNKMIGFFCRLDKKYDIIVTKLGTSSNKVKYDFFKNNIGDYKNKAPNISMDSLNNILNSHPQRFVDVDDFSQKDIYSLKIGSPEKYSDSKIFDKTQIEYNFVENPLNIYINNSKKANLQILSPLVQNIESYKNPTLGKSYPKKLNSLLIINYNGSLYLLNLIGKRWTEL